ncbi:MAG: LysM peptidoglycan-binding domain-containing M23 family metallopeptidase [Phenylobacterium sp.]
MTPNLKRSVLFAAAAAALTGCATAEPPRPNFPIHAPAEPVAAPPASAPEASGGAEAAPIARPTAPVESRPIEPPRASPLSLGPARLIRVANPAPSRARDAETRRVATGRVIEVDAGGGKTHTVKAGETVYRIALGFGISSEELARLNGLGKQPWIIRPGQVLKGPGGAKAKVYVTAEDDTLADVARRFTVTASAMAKANDLSAGDRLKAGQRLKLPAGAKDRGPQVVEAPRPPPAAPPAPRQVQAPPPPRPAAPAPLASNTSPPVTPPPAVRPTPPAALPVVRATPPTQASLPPAPARPLPQSPPGSSAPLPQAPAAPPPPETNLASLGPPRPPLVEPPPRPAPAAPPAPSAPPTLSPGDSEVARIGRGRFLWPVRGEVISGYGPKVGGQRNDGVNIRAPAGEMVRAAATGDVVYAGDQVPGFGNLVLIKHADGWVSAYGHLARIDVRIQERVAQGQQIGQVGVSGPVPEPQLHFEVRYAPTPQDRARPLDPMLVLPR